MAFLDNQTSDTSEFAQDLDPTKVVNEPYELFDLDVKDNDLVNRCVKSLNDNIQHWEKRPWLLKRTDIENINYILGEQIDEKYLLPFQTRYVDNRLFASVRSILAYATGQTAKPACIPSKTDDNYQRIAKNMESFLYQHANDHKVNDKMRLAAKNLIVRKRGCLKLYFDENYGPFGDVCTDNIDPADVVIDRYAKYGQDPNTVYFRQNCTIEELIAKFPDKEQEILNFYSIIQRRYSQMSRYVTYWECWFTYYDSDKKRRQGLCWFIPDSTIILGKMRNPNWIYTGDDKKDRITNFTAEPIKPFTWLNYWNTGRSFIDETCLFDQAVPMQDVLNKRGRQIVENADYANPRVLIDKRVMEQSDAKKWVNKSPKTVGMVDTTNSGNDITKAVMQIPGTQLPSFVLNDKFDARTEIDTLMGTPQQFRGDQTQGTKSPTLGQDLLVKNQAAALQDDIVQSINRGWVDYYTKLLQMQRVYSSDDYWIMTEGEDGQYAQITLTDDNIDTNVRLGVQIDSNLPIDKASQHQMAIQLAQLPGRIDDYSLFKMLGLPEPEKLAERVTKWNIDRMQYAESIETGLYNAEAEEDITLLINNKKPEDRDNYNADYINYWNVFMTTNRYMKLSPQKQERLTAFLAEVADKAALTESLRDTMVNPAGMQDYPPPMPQPMPGQEGVQAPAAGPASPPGQTNTAAVQGAAGGSPPRMMTPPPS